MPDIGSSILAQFRLVTLFGNFGVDLFFVLSGFLMVHLHRDMFGQPRAWDEFFRCHITRIVPLYWTLTTLALVLFLAAPQLFALHQGFDWPWVLGCYLFIPIPMKDGLAVPILGAGWTLEFEMYFYVLFTLALLWRRGLILLLSVLAVSTIIGFAFKFSRPWEDLVTIPMLLEFALGCLCCPYYAKVWGEAARCNHIDDPGDWIADRGCLCVRSHSSESDELRASSYNAAMGLRHSECASVAEHGMANPRCESRTGRTLVMVGDASYSIYLFQVLALPAIAIFMRMLHIPALLPVDVAIAVLWLLSCASGIGCWKFIEQPLTRRVKSALQPIRSLPATAQ